MLTLCELLQFSGYWGSDVSAGGYNPTLLLL